MRAEENPVVPIPYAWKTAVCNILHQTIQLNDTKSLGEEYKVNMHWAESFPLETPSQRYEAIQRTILNTHNLKGRHFLNDPNGDTYGFCFLHKQITVFCKIRLHQTIWQPFAKILSAHKSDFGDQP